MPLWLDNPASWELSQPCALAPAIALPAPALVNGLALASSSAAVLQAGLAPPALAAAAAGDALATAASAAAAAAAGVAAAAAAAAANATAPVPPTPAPIPPSALNSEGRVPGVAAALAQPLALPTTVDASAVPLWSASAGSATTGAGALASLAGALTLATAPAPLAGWTRELQLIGLSVPLRDVLASAVGAAPPASERLRVTLELYAHGLPPSP
jgi:hypothetical protein